LAERRVPILLCAFLAAGVLLLGRLAQMQLLWGGQDTEAYVAGPSGNRVLPAPRGTIYTSDGEVLARDVPVFDLAVHYKRLQDEDWVPLLSRLTGRSAQELKRTAAKVRARVERIWRAVKERTDMPGLRIVEQEQFHPVVRDVPAEVAALVRTRPEAFPGIKVLTRIRREYFHGDLAPHIVGRCARISPERWRELRRQGRAWTRPMPVSEAPERYCSDDLVGATGMERACEGVLRGKKGYVEHYLLFRPLSVERRAVRVPPEPGKDIYLTIRADFQRAANEALHWAAERPDLAFERGALVILDVNTGAVLAAATYPSYDLRSFQEEFRRLRSDPMSPLLFRPAQAALPTGSVYKLITAIAGLEEGKITPSTTLHCAGGVRFQGRWFRCTGHHGDVDLRTAIERSCNSYFFQVAAMLDGASMARWGRAFGLGQRTGTDLPFEAAGSVPEPRSLFGRLNLAIGQGRLLCTPLQVAQMCAAIANGGTIIQPHFLERVVRPDGTTVRWFEPRMQTIPVHEDTLRVVREGMHRVVVGRGGTARRAGLARFDVAGKTGTAELGAGRPNHAWFAGYAPFEHPRIAFAVVSERCPGHGGSHAAPIVARALEQIWPEVERMP